MRFNFYVGLKIMPQIQSCDSYSEFSPGLVLNGRPQLWNLLAQQLREDVSSVSVFVCIYLIYACMYVLTHHMYMYM